MRYGFMLTIVCLIAGCSSSYQYWQPNESSMAGATAESGAVHVVRKGESLHVIAWLYDLDYRDVAHWNNIRSPYVIYPDQELRLTAPDKNLSAERPSSAKKVSVQKDLLNTASVQQWVWPTRGQLICRFQQGVCKKGIYIQGKFRQDVFAAHAGTVVYSGTGVKDYGGLIILQHEKGYFSAYAHNNRLLVEENEQVIAGQKIGLMGMTRKNYPALYFEIRLNDRLLNPLELLPLTAT